MTIEGAIGHVVYENEKNGYKVMTLETQDGEYTIVGLMPLAEIGDYVQVEGEYLEHPMYGPQIKVTSYERKVPQDVISIRNYLGSGAIKGIGEKLASRIVDKFGTDTFRIMEEEPERLAEVKGISQGKAYEIAAQVQGKRQLRDAIIFLQNLGIGTSMAVRIYEIYKENIYNVLRVNPYDLVEKVSGIGFKTADAIALRQGLAFDSEFRICAAMTHLLQEAGGEGHTYLPRGELVTRAQELLQVDVSLVEKNLTDMILTRTVIAKKPMIQPDKGTDYGTAGVSAMRDSSEEFNVESISDPFSDDRSAVSDMVNEDPEIYLSAYYYTELAVARKLTDLASAAIRTQEKREKIEAELDRVIEEETQLKELDENQRLAVLTAITHGLTIVTGGPGTGKTTIINAMIRYFQKKGHIIALAAPTGRAAKRMSETTGHEAKTIHRLLEVSGAPDGAGMKFGRDELTPLDEDVVIVDEMSMVDIFLMNGLLKALVRGMHVVLVGDVDQLPSVGPGCVLRDIIESERFPVVKLTKIFRQAAMSDIIINAHKINRGQDVQPDPKSRDFLFVKRDVAAQIIGATITLLREKLPQYVHAPVRDIQVLTPMRKGVLGVENLNRELQNALNPPRENLREKEAGNIIFREGDKVMQIRNNYQKEWEVRGKFNIPIAKGMGVFNGDLGIIKTINLFTERVEVEFDEGRIAEYTYAELEELDQAYAVTIHKSQGSEYPAVILPLLSGPMMLMNRNLLYTAVTRAKSCVTVVGSVETFRGMIQNERQMKRYSGLKERLAEVL
ncbi:MAG: ATP-dependent RecD-like DNA helicase [Lachnospiraceae bacterium]|nr:ATP-dependent RecD-like DNA helicase [Lachnospiraceae bacterium]